MRNYRMKLEEMDRIQENIETFQSEKTKIRGNLIEEIAANRDFHLLQINERKIRFPDQKAKKEPKQS